MSELASESARTASVNAAGERQPGGSGMSSCAAPGHACMRVGPLGLGTLIAQWPNLGYDDEIRCHGWQAFTGTLLAADSGAPARLLATADVIVAAAEEGGANPGDWLRRCPGCAVAVSMAEPGEFSVAARGGGLHTMTVSGPQAIGPLACAVFVYGWLAAGLSLDLLRPTRLHLSHEPGESPEPESRLFFKFSYEASGSPASLDSAKRT